MPYFLRPILVATFLCAAPSVSAAFPDVPVSHPNAEAIEYVQSQGIVQGYPDGTYRPDQTINRAEFVKIIAETWVASDPGTGHMRGISPCFFHETKQEFLQRVGMSVVRDVDFTAWYGDYICHAMGSKIISGYPDGTIRPGQTINFVEAAKIIANTFALSPQMNTNSWYQGYVTSLEQHSMIPLSITSFDQSITRGEMAEMIWRLKEGVTDRPSRTYEELAAPVVSGDAQTTITLFFYSEQDVATASYEASFPVRRTIQKTQKVADATLRALFVGPTDEEYVNGARTMRELSSLAKDYIAVNVHKTYPNPYYLPNSDEEKIWENVALINFRSDAFDVLNGPAGTQMQVKAAIEATLKHFPTIDIVLYQKDGILFEHWDA